MKKFFSFERMITPIIIKILFWIGLVISAIAGIVVFLTGINIAIADGEVLTIIFALLLGGLGGILTFTLCALITRIYSELLILAFQINESLTDIKVLLEKNQPGE